ncbi:hypothetical protein JCM8547_003359 [Rhodosporidiobolus lusitaniae]
MASLVVLLGLQRGRGQSRPDPNPFFLSSFEFAPPFPPPRSPKPPALPAELILQVLDDPVLDLSTQAACCLLSKAFLKSSQRRLYRKISVEVKVEGRPGNPAATLCRLSPSTSKILRTLTASSLLASLVREICFETFDEWDTHGFHWTVSLTFERIFSLCCHFESLGTIPGFEGVCMDIFARDFLRLHRGQTLRLGFAGLSRDVLWSLVQAQSKVRHLAFCTVRFDSLDDEDLSNLDRLDLRLSSLTIPSFSRQHSHDMRLHLFTALTSTSHSTLRTLSLPADPSLCPSFDVFPCLVHLTLRLVHAPLAGVLPVLTTLPFSLLTLTISSPCSGSYAASSPIAASLPSFLPPSLLRLSLLRLFSPLALEALIRAIPAGIRLRELRFADPFKDSWYKMGGVKRANYDGAEEVGRERGMAVVREEEE